MLTVLEAIKSYWIILKHIKTPLYLVKSPFPIHMWSRSWPVYRCGTCRLFPLGSWYDRVLNKFWLWLEKHMLVWSNKFMIANNKTLHLIHGWWCEWIYIYIFLWLVVHFPWFLPISQWISILLHSLSSLPFPIASLFLGWNFVPKRTNNTCIRKV